MGTFYQLSIECGEDESLARSVERHYDGYSFEVTRTVRSTCSPRAITDGDQNWWVIVSPNGLSASGISSKEDAQQMTIAGRNLYDRLLSSPPFRYAIAGVETEEFKSFSELKEMDAGLYSRLAGLVMSRETWEAMSSPPGFVPFRNRYLWRPYQGEAFSQK